VAHVPQSHTPPFPYTALQVVTMGRAARIGPTVCELDGPMPMVNRSTTLKGEAFNASNERMDLGDHSGDGIPVSFFGYWTRPDDIQTYGERSCARGSYGKINREDTMYILGNLAGSVHKFGA